jgi:hypothetical protein
LDDYAGVNMQTKLGRFEIGRLVGGTAYCTRGRMLSQNVIAEPAAPGAVIDVPRPSRANDGLAAVTSATSVADPARAVDLRHKAQSQEFSAAWGDEWNPNPLSDVSI